jgi:threonine/homoserine/homoserine lactone efflux protein
MSLLVSFLLGIALGFASSIPAAGPLAILIVTAALDRDRRRAVRLAIGGALAEGIWAAVALLGMERVIHAGALRLVQAVGAVVLIALGALMLRAPRAARTESSPAHAVVGFVIVATNPGFLIAWLGFAAAIASFGRVAPIATALGAIAGIVLWFLTLYALVARFAVREETLRRITRVLGVAVIGFGVAVAVTVLKR